MSNISGEINQVSQSIVRGVVNSISHVQGVGISPSLSAYRTAAAQDIIDATKQDKLIAGSGITIAEDGKTISATGGGGGTAEKYEVIFSPVSGVTDVVTCSKTPTEIVAAYSGNKIIVAKYMASADYAIGLRLKYIITESESMEFVGDPQSNSVLRIIKSGSSWRIENAYLQLTSDKVTSLSSSSTDAQYPSAKCVYDGLARKGTYSKPATGIPSTDMTSAVQASLAKADTAAQKLTVEFTMSGTTPITATAITDIYAAILAGKIVEAKSGANGIGEVIGLTYYRYYSNGNIDVTFTATVAEQSIAIVGIHNETAGTDTWTASTVWAEDSVNKVTSLSSSSTDTQYPSAKSVYDAVSAKAECFTVHFTYANDTFTADATLAQIYAAYAAGKIIEGELVEDRPSPYTDGYYKLVFSGVGHDGISATYCEFYNWQNAITKNVFSCSIVGGVETWVVTQEVYAEKLTVTFTESNGTITADKTISEIYTACTNGKIVEGKLTSAIALGYVGYDLTVFRYFANGMITLAFTCDLGTTCYVIQGTYNLTSDAWQKEETEIQTKGITDSGGYYTTDTVEGALQELGAKVAALEAQIASLS